MDRSFIAAAANGAVVTTAARSTHDLSPMHNKGLSLHAVFMLLPILTGKGREQYGEILEKISTLVDAGKLRPLIDDNKFNLQNVSQAHALLEAGKAKGKVVISVVS